MLFHQNFPLEFWEIPEQEKVWKWKIPYVPWEKFPWEKFPSRGKSSLWKSSRSVGKVLFGKVPEGKVPFGKFPVGKYPVWQFPVGKSNLESFLQPLKMLEVWKLSYFFRNHDDEWSFSLSNNTVFKTHQKMSHQNFKPRGQ